MLKRGPDHGDLKDADGNLIRFVIERSEPPRVGIKYLRISPGEVVMTRMQTTLWPFVRSDINGTWGSAPLNGRTFVPGEYAVLVLGVLEHHAYVLADGHSGWISRRALTREDD